MQVDLDFVREDEKDVIQLGFRPDNVRMSPDGSVMFAAGHTDKDGHSIKEPREPLKETSNVARIDPKTLKFERIFQHSAMDGFVATTTAIQIGNEMWLGSQRGERIAGLRRNDNQRTRRCPRFTLTIVVDNVQNSTHLD